MTISELCLECCSQPPGGRDALGTKWRDRISSTSSGHSPRCTFTASQPLPCFHWLYTTWYCLTSQSSSQSQIILSSGIKPQQAGLPPGGSNTRWGASNTIAILFHFPYTHGEFNSRTSRKRAIFISMQDVCFVFGLVLPLSCLHGDGGL